MIPADSGVSLFLCHERGKIKIDERQLIFDALLAVFHIHRHPGVMHLSNQPEGAYQTLICDVSWHKRKSYGVTMDYLQI